MSAPDKERADAPWSPRLTNIRDAAARYGCVVVTDAFMRDFEKALSREYDLMRENSALRRALAAEEPWRWRLLGRLLRRVVLLPDMSD